MIKDSISETGSPVSSMETGSDGRNDSSAIIVASKSLLKERGEIVSDILLRPEFVQRFGDRQKQRHVTKKYG